MSARPFPTNSHSNGHIQGSAYLLASYGPKMIITPFPKNWKKVAGLTIIWVKRSEVFIFLCIFAALLLRTEQLNPFYYEVLSIAPVAIGRLLRLPEISRGKAV